MSRNGCKDTKKTLLNMKSAMGVYMATLVSFTTNWKLQAYNA